MRSFFLTFLLTRLLGAGMRGRVVKRIFRLLVAAALVASACGRVARQDVKTPAASGLARFDMTQISSKAPLALDWTEPTALPAADGSWIAVETEPFPQAQEFLPCVWDGISVRRLVTSSAGKEPSELRSADGSQILDTSSVVTRPPGVRAGDPVAVSSLSCDSATGEPTRALLLGSVGENGIPAGLTPILGPGAPVSAPSIDPVRWPDFSSAFSPDRTRLTVVITIDCTTPDSSPCYRSEPWNYDLSTGTWSEREDPSFKNRGLFGAPTVFADGSLLESFDEGQWSWMTYRGSPLYENEVAGVADLAPDGLTALIGASSAREGKTVQSLQLLSMDGTQRTLYEALGEGPEYWDGGFCCASFGADGSTVYIGIWSEPPATDGFFTLWSIDVATGTQTKLVETPGARYFRLLPDGSGILVAVDSPSGDSGSRTWELWTFAPA